MLACLGHQNIASGSLGSAATLTLPAGTQRAWLQASGGSNVRFTLEGTTPTASVGAILVNGGIPIDVTLEMGLASAKFILESGTPNLSVTYFGTR